MWRFLKKKKFRCLEKKFRLLYLTEIWPWFRFPIAKPGFGHTLFQSLLKEKVSLISQKKKGGGRSSPLSPTVPTALLFYTGRVPLNLIFFFFCNSEVQFWRKTFVLVKEFVLPCSPYVFTENEFTNFHQFFMGRKLIMYFCRIVTMLVWPCD